MPLRATQRLLAAGYGLIWLGVGDNFKFVCRDGERLIAVTSDMPKVAASEGGTAQVDVE
jgi:hypothetical protein